MSTAQGTVAGARSTSGAKAIGGSGYYGSGGAVKTAGGDMYAGKDGNVYKNTGSGWQSYNNGSWSSANRPTSTQQRTGATSSGSFNRPQMQSSQMQGLNQEFQNRQRGAMQSQNFQNFQRSGGVSGGRFGGGGGGGFGGGGGRFGGGRRR